METGSIQEAREAKQKIKDKIQGMPEYLGIGIEGNSNSGYSIKVILSSNIGDLSFSEFTHLPVRVQFSEAIESL